MSKLKIIVVDDEMLIRKLIRMKIEALNLDVEIVGEYADTVSAIQAVEEQKPDIVFSDICMPGGDGISFSELCIKKYPHIKIIIITGFNDFDYARRSIKAGVSDYIMKPVQSEELEQAIEHVSREIREKRMEEEKKKLLEDELKNSLPVLQSIYINKLISGDFWEEDSEKKLSELGIQASANHLIRVGILAMRESIDNPNLPILVEAETGNFFFGEDKLYLLRDVWGRVIILSSNTDFPMEQCLEMLVELLTNKFGCHINWAASNVFEGFREIRSAYLDAVTNLTKNHSEKTYLAEPIDEADCDCIDVSADVFSLIKSGKAAMAREAVRSIIAGIDDALSQEVISKRILLILREICRETEVDYRSIEKENPIENYHNKTEYLWWIEERMTRILLLQNTEDQQLTMLRDAVVYMRTNIADPDMNQNDLASMFNVSSSHFGRLMKQYIGRNYSDVVSEIRLSIMLKSLYETNLKDRDIGEIIGITDAHYLSIWFKKVTGYSVSEYRKKYLQEK